MPGLGGRVQENLKEGSVAPGCEGLRHLWHPLRSEGFEGAGVCGTRRCMSCELLRWGAHLHGDRALAQDAPIWVQIPALWPLSSDLRQHTPSGRESMGFLPEGICGHVGTGVEQCG